jgi:poly(A) polymerase/tRNA nucleotidyltransferase (CCA-adding enzyme)
VGDPAARIAEEYLRILRFFRFRARYGHGEPDAAALDALRGGVPGLARLSPERVWSELKRILATPDPRGAIQLMDALGVLPAVLPGPFALACLDRLLNADGPADPLLRLAAFVPGAGLDLAARLRMSAAERDRLVAWAGPLPAPDMDDDALRRLLADAPPGALTGRAWLAGDAGADWAALRDRLAGLPRPVFPLEGRDALALGVPPGPGMGELLRGVRAWWMEGGCRAGAAACRAELARRLAG